MGLTFVLALAVMPTWLNAQSPQPPLQMVWDGEPTHPNNCSTPSELARLKEQVMGVTESEIPAAMAWPVIQAMLCGDTARDRRLVRQHMPKRLWIGHDSTGEDPVRGFVERSTEWMASGNVWSAEARFDGHDLSVTYNANEACLASFSLRAVHGQWLIVGVGGACD